VDGKTVADFLRDFPAELERAVEGLSDKQLRAKPGPEDWSVLEVCCHLRDAFEIEGMRIRALLTAPGIVLPAFDGHAYVAHRLYNLDALDRVLSTLENHCEDLASLVGDLDARAWARSGVHEEAGPVTVGSRAEGLVEHGGDHLQQIKTLREKLPRH